MYNNNNRNSDLMMRITNDQLFVFIISILIDSLGKIRGYQGIERGKDLGDWKIIE